MTVSSEELLKSLGYGGRIGFGNKPALLIIDLSKIFTDPSSPLGMNLDNVIESTGRLLAKAREKQIPVIFTTVGFEDPSRELAVKKMPGLGMAKVESRWVEIDDRLKPLPGEPIIVKRYTSAFSGTHLVAMLVNRGVDTVIIAGCETSGCIVPSVREAVQYGFRPIIPIECVGDRSQAAHEASLTNFGAKWGDVVALDEVVHYIDSLS